MGRPSNIRLASLWIVAAVILLTSCTSTQKPNIPYVNTTVRGAAGGAASGAVIGALGGFGGPVGAAIGGVAGTLVGHNIKRYQPRAVQLENELDKAGVQFVRLGEDYRLILPADYFFYPDSPRLNHTGRFYLNVAAEYLRLFDIDAVRVTGFTDNGGLPERNRAMSIARATQVVDYLTKHKLDVRMLTSRGHGADYPIASNRTPKGRAMNRRVEIQFRLIQATTIT